MSEKALLIAKEEIVSVILSNKPHLNYEEASELATQILETIEWDNPVLMHKGIEWITLQYLKQLVII